jgi:hypothetical protein
MLSRREMIGKAAVGAAAAAVALGAARTGRAAKRALRGATTTPTPSGGPGVAATPEHQTPANDQNAPAQPGDAAPVLAPPPWDLVRPFIAGALVSHGWRLSALSPVQDGSCVATLENARGRAHRVHLCRNDGDPQGLIYTRRVDLVVMNQGTGDLPTEEGLAQAVAELAHAVAANEARLPAVLAELVPHAERMQRFASADGTLAGGKLR